MPLSLTPRRALRAALVAITLLSAPLLAACGTGDQESTTTATTATTSAFPVTIEHARGTTTIPSQPKRVVTIGWSDQDPVLALGVKPVGTIEWFDEQPGAIFPWAKQAAGGSVPEIVGTAGQIDYEKVAALHPDLILALYEGIDQSAYDKLSKIAPTVANSPRYDAFGATWEDMTRTAGKALGREKQAETLITQLNARFAEIRAAHPQWAEQTLLVMATVASGTYQVFSPQDPKARFFAQLGFDTQPPWLKGRVEDNLADVSAEEVRLLDVDRLVWTSDPDVLGQLAKDKLYNRLDVVKDKRVSYLDYTKPPFPGAAVTFNTVLSIPYALDQVLPQLSAGRNGH